ncbi:MAG: hypothetical protein WCD49_18720, partial [Candidatus Acidiferrales bacterium]
SAVRPRPSFSTAWSPTPLAENFNRGVKDVLATTVKDVMAPYTEGGRYKIAIHLEMRDLHQDEAFGGRLCC